MVDTAERFLQVCGVTRFESGTHAFPTSGDGGERAEAPEGMIGRTKSRELPSTSRKDRVGVGRAELPPPGPKCGDFVAGGPAWRFRPFEKAGQAEEQRFAAGGSGDF